MLPAAEVDLELAEDFPEEDNAQDFLRTEEELEAEK
jgi:hypothetical protein